MDMLECGGGYKVILNSLPVQHIRLDIFQPSMKKNLKIVVVGDGSCGKTSLIVAQAGGGFTEQYTPTAFDDYAIESLVNGKPKMLTVCDTAGEEEFNSLRPLSYPDADVFIVCYSVERAESMKHIRERWIPEIRHFCPNVPVLIVGNKKDIRSDIGRKSSRSENVEPAAVELEDAEALAREVSSLPLIECSAKQRENIRLVFDTAIRAAVAYRSRRSNKVIQSIMKLKLVF
uniref:Rho-related GTP-binding protein RhoU n=1 Tax=Panagrellus redivivus TaxID=6233 RepID=A0A7E4UWA9_PANRE